MCEEISACRDTSSRTARQSPPGLHPQAILFSVEEVAELGRELTPQFLTLGMS